MLEDMFARLSSSPGWRAPVRPRLDLPGLAPLVQHQAGDKEGDSEQVEEDDSCTSKVTEASQDRHALNDKDCVKMLG